MKKRRNSYVLSYVLITRNKLPYLRNAVSDLLANIRTDEEIVVVDGGSTDGSVKFLDKLYKQGKLNYFVSGPDKGEGHAWNKTIFFSQGELIKFITDDDVFDYKGIQKCRAFMLSHPEVDLLAGNGASTDWSNPNIFYDLSSEYLRSYRDWKRTGKPFAFCGLGFMWRRQSIPLIGLFNTRFVRNDAEISLRVTASPANLAWYTGHLFVRLTNPDSITVTKTKQMTRESEILDLVYFSRKGNEHNLISKLFPLLKFQKDRPPKLTKKFYQSPPNAWNLCRDWLLKTNRQSPGRFLYKKH